MSRSTRPPRRAAAALVTAAVAAVVGLGGASAAQADTFRWTSPNYITYTVQGAILDHYRAHGGPNGRLNYPFSDELATPDRFGRFTVFGGGSIYWTPWTGAHAVWGAILGRWGSLGWEAGQLGYPTTDELVTPDRVGRVQVVQRGLVYWTPWTGAHAVWGAIQQRYAALGWERSAIAYPTTSELATPDGRGRYNTFSRGGAIYWTTSTGAHAVWGAIWQTYSSNGWEAGPLGYPVTSELPTPDGIGRFNHFEDGSIYLSPATGAYAVTSEFRDVWASMG